MGFFSLIFSTLKKISFSYRRSKKKNGPVKIHSSGNYKGLVYLELDIFNYILYVQFNPLNTLQWSIQSLLYVHKK